MSIYPELRFGVEATKKRLQTIGFRKINFSLDNTDVLFLNPNLTSISPFYYLKLKYFTRNVEGARRWLHRISEKYGVPEERTGANTGRVE